MKLRPAAFRFIAADTVEEVVGGLRELGPEARVIAGGQSLVPLMNLRLARPDVLIDLGRISGLRDILIDGGRASIGATATHAAVMHSPTLEGRVPILRAAGQHIGHAAIRNRGTLGGSLCHADPAAEWPTVALGLGGEARLVSRDGERRIALSEFFLGPFMTAVREDELLASVALDLPPTGSGWSFQEFSRQSGSFALVIVSVVARRSPDGELERLSIAVGGCGPVPALLDTRSLLGARLERLDDVAAALARGLDAPSDIHASAEDRRRIARALIERGLTEALG